MKLAIFKVLSFQKKSLFGSSFKQKTRALNFEVQSLKSAEIFTRTAAVFWSSTETKQCLNTFFGERKMCFRLHFIIDSDLF